MSIVEEQIFKLREHFKKPQEDIRVIAEGLPVCGPTCAQRYYRILTSRSPRPLRSSRSELETAS